jgi:SAM-dependent methyltransferase
MVLGRSSDCSHTFDEASSHLSRTWYIRVHRPYLAAAARWGISHPAMFCDRPNFADRWMEPDLLHDFGLRCCLSSDSGIVRWTTTEGCNQIIKNSFGSGIMQMRGTETFGDTSFWDEYGTTSDYAERIVLIQSLIPPRARKLLDIGCGKGDVINVLSANNSGVKIVGVDPFLEAMRFLNVPAVQAVLPHIPFGDRAFDVVICLQVLEHLYAADFFPALVELQRLAQDHVIIGVPYKENLQALQVRCSACGRYSHAYGHMRSFEKDDMANLLPGFIVEKLVLAGVIQRSPSRFGTFVEHYVADRYHVPTDFVCPYCQHNLPATSNRPAVIRWSAQLLNKGLTSLSRLMPYWMIVLYRRKGTRTSNERDE